MYVNHLGRNLVMEQALTLEHEVAKETMPDGERMEKSGVSCLINSSLRTSGMGDG